MQIDQKKHLLSIIKGIPCYELSLPITCMRCLIYKQCLKLANDYNIFTKEYKQKRKIIAMITYKKLYGIADIVEFIV